MEKTKPTSPLLSDVNKLRTLSVARFWVPRDSSVVSTATMFRWANRGIAGIKLEVLRMPGGTFTSEAAVHDFLTRVHEAREAACKGEADKPLNSSEEDLRAAGLLSIGGAS